MDIKLWLGTDHRPLGQGSHSEPLLLSGEPSDSCLQ